MDNNAMRLLAASGPLMQQGFPSGMPRPMFPANLSAVGMEQANQLQQALRNQMICQNMPPELSSEVLASQMPRAPFMMDPNTVAFHPYLALDGGRRRNATREITQPLKTWLTEHKKNPYPSKPEKIMLAMFTGMTLTQVSTWFANARRRLKKENKMTWSPRNGRGDSDDDDDFDPSETLETSTEMKSDLKLDIKSEIELNSPKKHKIWSIAENLQNSRAESTNSNASKDSKPEEDTKIGGMSNNPLNNMQIPTGQQSSGFNPLMMAAMNRMLPPQFYAAFMQQQAQAQQAQAQVQQQQLAAMLRNAGAFPSMFLNNFFGMPGMNLPGPSNVQIPSTSSSTSPNPDLVNTSDNCDTTATTSSNLANTSGSATTTSDDRESRSPSPLLKIPKFEQTELSPEKKKSDDSTNCSSSK